MLLLTITYVNVLLAVSFALIAFSIGYFANAAVSAYRERKLLDKVLSGQASPAELLDMPIELLAKLDAKTRSRLLEQAQ